MRFSSRKCAAIISNVASRIYFFIIIAQVPLFRFPCRIGTCQTPIDMTACQMIASNFPEVIVEGLLYPGAIIRSLMEGTTIPNPDQLLNSYKSNMRNRPAAIDLQHFEVFIGSYLCVGGAILGLMKGGRLRLLGLNLILWGIVREMYFGKNDATDHSDADVRLCPEMAITMVIAFFSMRRDVRHLIRCCKFECIVRLVERYSKAKYK